MFRIFIALGTMMICYHLTANASNSKTSNISRFQYRHSNLNEDAITLSSFFKLEDTFFILGVYNGQFDSDQNYTYLTEINLGIEIKRNLQFIFRAQKASDISIINSAGLQFDISGFANVKDFFKSRDIVTFLQILPITDNRELLRYEILHYYAIPIYKKISIRGYNQFIKRENEGMLYNLWADIIYPINKGFDLYIRLSHRSDDDVVYGNKGQEVWLGFRLNYSL